MVPQCFSWGPWGPLPRLSLRRLSLVVNGVWPVSELRLSFPPAVKRGRTTTCHRRNLWRSVEEDLRPAGRRWPQCVVCVL